MSVMKLLICCLAVASAFELPAMSRRSLMARVAAAAPLAAVAQQAMAERPSNAIFTSPDGKSAQWMSAANSNTVLGAGKGGVKPGYDAVIVEKSIGRDAKIDEWGSAAGEGKAALAAASNIGIGAQPKNEAAFARLLK